MSLKAFNLAILVGWLLALIGGCLINFGGGLAAGGLLLICITLLLARLAGVYAPGTEKKDSD